jgi:WD domain, G-beta repeat
LKQPKIQMSTSASQNLDQYPYTAISISPCRNYAVTASKDIMQIIRISPMGIRVIKTINMAQYFQMPSTSTSPSSTTVGTTIKSSTTGKSNIGTIMDSSLFSRVDTSPAQASSSVNITDVAWSIGPLQYVSSATTRTVSHKNLDNTNPHQHHSTSPQHYAHNKDDYIDWKSDNEEEDWITDDYDNKGIDSANATSSSTGTCTSSTDSNSKKKSTTKENNQSRRGTGGSTSNKHPDNPNGSFIATAGSNGSIIIWNVETLLESILPSSQTGSKSASTENQGSKLHHGTGKAAGSSSTNQQQQQQQQQQHLVTPEAVLNHHNRDVSRLAWHPIKYGLLLSGSQDGTIRLWERKHFEQTSVTTTTLEQPISTKIQQHTTTTKVTNSTSTSSSGGGGGMFSSLFGGIRTTVSRTHPPPVVEIIQTTLTVPKKSAYEWHSIATYEPKSEAVRDIRWSPYYNDGMYVLFYLYVTGTILFTQKVCLFQGQFISF